jgi:hypothetical protein
MKKLAPYILLACLLAGCDRLVVVRGKVLDVRGAALPGVAVTVQGADYDTLTDGLGQYSLRCASGTLNLEFMKTGYTPGILRVEAKDRMLIDVLDAVIWPLPGRKGVYLFEQFRYQEMSRIEPKRYVDANGKPVFAIKNDPAVETLEMVGAERRPGAPLILCFKQPDFDATLCRMVQAEVTLPQAATQSTAQSGTPPSTPAPVVKEKAWVVWEKVESLLTPIDEQTKQLAELRPMLPLSPGVYAVHWGALEGHTSTDPHAFLFRIAEPPVPLKEAEPAVAKKGEPTPAKKEAPQKKEAAPAKKEAAQKSEAKEPVPPAAAAPNPAEPTPAPKPSAKPSAKPASQKR